MGFELTFAQGYAAGLAAGSGFSTLEEALADEFGGATTDYVVTATAIYRVLADLDFTALATADWSADTADTPTAKTVGSLSMTSTRGSTATTWGIVNGGGLRCVTSGAGNPSSLAVNWSDLYAGLDQGTDTLIMQLAATIADWNGTATNLVFQPIYMGANDFAGMQAAYIVSGSDYEFRARQKRASTDADVTNLGSSASEPTALRGEMEWTGASLIYRGAYGAGALGDPRTLAELVRTSNDARGTASDYTTPASRVVINAQGVVDVTVTRVRWLRRI